MSKRIRKTIVAAAVMGLLTAGLGAGAKWNRVAAAAGFKPTGAKWAQVTKSGKPTFEITPTGAKWS